MDMSIPDFVIRKDILKEALEDPETRLRMNCAVSWNEIKSILREFAEKKGWQIAGVAQDARL